MEIRYLAEFVALAKTCSFLETSNRIFVSQSSLTRHIQSLEDELGVSLFDRSGKKIKLSIYGELFLPYAKKLIELHRDGKRVIDAYNQDHDNTVVLGCIPYLQEYADLYSKIRAYNNSGNRIRFVEADTFDLIDMMHNGELDFAIMRLSDHMDVTEDTIELFEDPVIAVVPQDHRFAERETIRLIELADERMCLLHKDTMLSRMCKTACREAGCEPKISFTSMYYESIIQRVKDGFGVGMLTEQTTKKFADDGVRLIHFDPELTTKICLVYNKNQRISMAGMHFLNILESR